ncbi:hypothetical protein CLOSYM_04087 [[Clostridium] symbiosum ATCC 14940]|uniref:Uncharacterized protein n=1 Tax=[Clostridium] symbiosum ATCC 14940 TaxID=411472 RepID=A0ABC9TSM0_CLOSY|nr:hypothetical protein CLOSYM_04087 [[Clostridium] symbiosum ATCC 14940]
MRLYLIPTENHGIIQYATTHNYKAFPGIKQYYSAVVGTQNQFALIICFSV